MPIKPRLTTMFQLDQLVLIGPSKPSTVRTWTKEVSVGPAGPHWSIFVVRRGPAGRHLAEFQLDQLVLIGPSLPRDLGKQGKYAVFQLDQLVLIGPSTDEEKKAKADDLGFSWTSWSSLVHHQAGGPADPRLRVRFSWTSWSSLVHRRDGSQEIPGRGRFLLDQLVLIGPSLNWYDFSYGLEVSVGPAGPHWSISA